MIGGPQKRGRSPMMKDNSRSTWWMAGEQQREHFAKWMEVNRIHANKNQNNNNNLEA